MSDKRRPSIEVLRESIRYDPGTGQLCWRRRPASHFSSPNRAEAWNRRFAGKQAGRVSEMRSGLYGRVSLFGREIPSHHVAWAIYYGRWPEQMIDHVNGRSLDNKISNLREADHAVNARNQKLNSVNTSGVQGVSPHKRGGWYARIMVNKEERYLGYFKSLEDAKRARIKAERAVHGYTGRAALEGSPNEP